MSKKNKIDDMILILLVILLICGILLTILFRGRKSKHGYGAHPPATPYAAALTSWRGNPIIEIAQAEHVAQC